MPEMKEIFSSERVSIHYQKSPEIIEKKFEHGNV